MKDPAEFFKNTSVRQLIKQADIEMLVCLRNKINREIKKLRKEVIIMGKCCGGKKGCKGGGKKGK